jgi:hypothetical protein
MAELRRLATVVTCRSRDIDEPRDRRSPYRYCSPISEALITTAMASPGRSDKRTAYNNKRAAGMERNELRKDRTGLCALPAIRGFRGRGVIG